MAQAMTEESEFKQKNDLIQKLLEGAGLGFLEGLNDQEKEQLDVERQTLVIRAGWAEMSVEELEKLLRRGSRRT